MLRVTLRGVQGHLLRFLLTVFSVTLGVAFVAGTFVLTDSLDSTFSSIVDQGAKGLDVQVRGREAGRTTQEDGNQAIREQLPLSLQDSLRAVPGVARVSSDIQGNGLVVGKDGTPVRNGGAPSFVFPFRTDDPALRLVQGRAPAGPGEVVLESSTLTLSKLQVGDRTQALIAGRPRDVTVVGEASFEVGLAGATVVAIDEATAVQLLAPDGKVPSFGVQAAPGTDVERLRADVARLLPANAEAVPASTVVDEAKQDIREALGFISIFLIVFAVISVVVGAFIIYNTFSMLVAQRTRELALLRAVGAERGQVVRSVVGEGVVVGLAGSVLGLLVGLGLAQALIGLFGTFGLKISGGLPVLPRTVVWAFVVGVLVTAAVAYWPARRASRIPPVAAMRDEVVVTSRGLRRRGIVGGVLLVLGIAAVVAAVAPDDVQWGLFGLGAALALVGVLVIAPLAARPVVRVVAAPFVATTRVAGRIARENALRVPRRTATTASALLIGLALVSAVSVAAQSTKASVADLVENQLTADYVLSGGGAPLPPTLAESVGRLPDVDSVAPLSIVAVDAGPVGRLTAVAAEPDALRQNVVLDVPAGSIDVLSSGQVLVSEAVAKDRGLAVGAPVTATLGVLKQAPLTVGGVFASSQVLGDPGMIIPRSLYTRALPPAQQGDALLYVKARPGVEAAALRAPLVETVKPFLVVSVQDAAQFTSSQADQVNQLLLIIYALLALSVIIAVIGIVNTLALSVFERTREIGLLRAVGLSRGQLSGTITIEAVATAVFGAVLGAVLGLGLGIALQRGLRSQGLETLAIPWGTILGVLLLAAVAGVVAAVLPAIRAVRLNVLRAIATE